MATLTSSTYTFTTVGELPEDFEGELEVQYYDYAAFVKLEVEQIAHNVGTRGLTEVHADAFEEGYAYLTPKTRVRIAK